jgi:hypothetical protein
MCVSVEEDGGRNWIAAIRQESSQSTLTESSIYLALSESSELVHILYDVCTVLYHM